MSGLISGGYVGDFHFEIPKGPVESLICSTYSFIVDSTVQKIALGALVGFAASYVEKNPLSAFGSGIIGGVCAAGVSRFSFISEIEQAIGSKTSYLIEILKTSATVQKALIGLSLGVGASYLEGNPLTAFGSGVIGGIVGAALGCFNVSTSTSIPEEIPSMKVKKTIFKLICSSVSLMGENIDAVSLKENDVDSFILSFFQDVNSFVQSKKIFFENGAEISFKTMRASFLLDIENACLQLEKEGALGVVLPRELFEKALEAHLGRSEEDELEEFKGKIVSQVLEEFLKDFKEFIQRKESSLEEVGGQQLALMIQAGVCRGAGDGENLLFKKLFTDMGLLKKTFLTT